jgi:hypothetical protein
MFGLWPANKPEKAGNNPVALKISLASQKVSFAGPVKGLIRLIKFPNKNSPEQEESFVHGNFCPYPALQARETICIMKLYDFGGKSS